MVSLLTCIVINELVSFVFKCHVTLNSNMTIDQVIAIRVNNLVFLFSWDLLHASVLSVHPVKSQLFFRLYAYTVIKLSFLLCSRALLANNGV